MEFEIAGASNFGSVLVSGSRQFALNGGTVQGALEGGFTPPIPGPGFAVLSGTHSGTFTTVTGGFAAT
jgi:hypothetical protein